MLVVTLVAVVFGYTRYQLIYLNARSVSRANGPISRPLEIKETNGALNRIYSNANGDVVSASIKGPSGFKELRKGSASRTIERLSLESQIAFDAFVPSEFPIIQTLALSRLNWNEVDFTKLRDVNAFAKLKIVANAPPPEFLVNKLPHDVAVDDIEITAFQHAGSDVSGIDVPSAVKILIINSPDLDGEQLVLLQQRHPQCRVVGYNVSTKKIVDGG